MRYVSVQGLDSCKAQGRHLENSVAFVNEKVLDGYVQKSELGILLAELHERKTAAA